MRGKTTLSAAKAAPGNSQKTPPNIFQPKAKNSLKDSACWIRIPKDSSIGFMKGKNHNEAFDTAEETLRKIKSRVRRPGFF